MPALRIKPTDRSQRPPAPRSTPTDFRRRSNGLPPPRDRKYLTRQNSPNNTRVASRYRKIRAFATQYGLKVASEDRAGRTVKLTGTVRAFNDAFGATSAVTNTLPVHIAATTAPHNRRPRRHCRKAFSASTIAPKPNRISVCAKSQRATQRHRRFLFASSSRSVRFPSGATGSGQCIALIELGGGYNSSDLTQFFSNLGITAPKSPPFPSTAPRIRPRATPAAPTAGDST